MSDPIEAPEITAWKELKRRADSDVGRFNTNTAWWREAGDALVALVERQQDAYAEAERQRADRYHAAMEHTAELERLRGVLADTPTEEEP